MSCVVIAMSMFVSGWKPPPEYDYEPARPVPVVAVPCEFMRAACGGYYLGCYKPQNNVIIVDDRLKGEYREKVERHERGHANGWRH